MLLFFYFFHYYFYILNRKKCFFIHFKCVIVLKWCGSQRNPLYCLSLLSLMMGTILMCVYTLHSSRPGRPPKRSYGAGLQESSRILHQRANSLLSPALLSPTGKPNRTHTRLVFHHVQCPVNLDEPQFTHSQPPSTHMKSICLNHSLLCCPSAHLSFSLPFCRSVRSSFMHLLYG